MVNIGYRAARMQGYFLRSLYRSTLPLAVKLNISNHRRVPIDVYYFSCDRDLPEQVASIRSFISYVGIPDKFTVVSDGTYSLNSCQLLRQISPCIDVVEFANFVKKDLPQCVYQYANIHPLGKKLAVLMSIPVEKITIFADSDILFFPAAEELLKICQVPDRRPRYLLDWGPALDKRLLDRDSEKWQPVNSGFMLLQQPLNWEIPLTKLAALAEIPSYFTEQTTVHLAMHYNQGVPLASDRFVVKVDDQFIYQDKYSGHQVALRHYVNPVRHKFWFHIGLGK
ncbi:MAG TPA: hypothetical protein V6D28_13380 [Leptolyngbyaceae cyanobacterium]